MNSFDQLCLFNFLEANFCVVPIVLSLNQFDSVSTFIVVVIKIDTDLVRSLLAFLFSFLFAGFLVSVVALL